MLCLLHPGHAGFQISILLNTLHGSDVKFISHRLEVFCWPGFSYGPRILALNFSILKFTEDLELPSFASAGVF